MLIEIIYKSLDCSIICFNKFFYLNLLYLFSISFLVFSESCFFYNKIIHDLVVRSEVLYKVCPSYLNSYIFEQQNKNSSTFPPELEKYAAELFGKEAALLVVSGTMGNLISVACHCDVRGNEVFVGDKCHIYKWEQGGVAQVCLKIFKTLIDIFIIG